MDSNQGHRPVEKLTSGPHPHQNVDVPKFGAYIWGIVGVDDKRRESLSQVEQNAERFANTYCVVSAIPTRELLKASEAPAILHIAAEIAALQMAYGRRLATMYCDSVFAISRSRLHLAALALRAYLELTGAVTFFEQRLTKILVDGVSTQELWRELRTLLDLGLGGGRFDWIRYWKGGSALESLLDEYARAKDHEHEPAPENRQKSPGAFIAEVEKQVSKRWPAQKGKARYLYAILSDICHPAFGGDLLFADSAQDPYWTRHCAGPCDEMTREFVRCWALPILLDITLISTGSLNRLGQVADNLTQTNKSGEVLRMAPEGADRLVILE